MNEEQLITFNATVSPDHSAPAVQEFYQSWPESTARSAPGPSLRMRDVQLVTTAIVSVATSTAFAKIIVAWIGSRRRRVTLSCGDIQVVYEGPDPKEDLPTMTKQISKLATPTPSTPVEVLAHDLEISPTCSAQPR